MDNTEEVVVPAPAHTQASVGVPDDLTANLGMVKELTGGNPVVAVILVAILVLGGKTGWAFWDKRQKLKMELEEKRLELETKVKLAQIKADDDNDVKKAKKGKKA